MWGMIIERTGDIFESGLGVLVNPVNCVGVMGGGMALECRRRWPGMYLDYCGRCDRGEVEVGRPYLWVGERVRVVNFPTKMHWRQPARVEWVRMGLEGFVKRWKEWGITGVAFPRLGCGLGGLRWEEVRPLMWGYLAGLEIPVEIWELDERVSGCAGGKCRPRMPEFRLERGGLGR
jgi:O-acetyl-ADP-ribose deacetylase (regulator of RNase III)